MKYFIYTILVSFCFFSLSSNYFINKSLRAQFLMEGRNTEFSLSQVDSMLPFYPFASATSQPLDLQRATSSFSDGNIDLGYKYLQSARSQNPYTFYPELILSRYHLRFNNIDSAYYYSNLAFKGWPKNIEHFENHLKILSMKGDTLAIIEAGKYVGDKVSKQGDYIKLFKEYINKAKLFYLDFDYPDARQITNKELQQKWVRAYNFKGSKSVLDSTQTFAFTKNTVTIFGKEKLEYNYQLKNDSLFYYFTNSKDPFFKIKISYSPSKSTLIFSDVKVANGYQIQFYKPVE